MAAVPRPEPARPGRPARVVAGDPAVSIVRRPAHAEGRPQRPPLLVVPPRARRRRAGLLTVVACCTLFLVMLGPVALQMKIAADQGHLDDLDRRTRQAQHDYDALRLQVAQLQAPAAVVAAAQAQGMVVPAQITYVAPTPAAVASVTESAGPAGPPSPKAPGADPASWSAVKRVVSSAP